MLLRIQNKYVFELFVIKHFGKPIINQQASYQVPWPTTPTSRITKTT